MATPTPGWYPDPTDPDRQRFWDGTGWTGRQRPTSDPAADPVSGPVGQDAAASDQPVPDRAGVSAAGSTGPSGPAAHDEPASSGATPTPGWYPDPTDPDRQRFWDGTGWTGQTREVAPREPQAPAVSEVQTPAERAPAVTQPSVAGTPAVDSPAAGRPPATAGAAAENHLDVASVAQPQRARNAALFGVGGLLVVVAAFATWLWWDDSDEPMELRLEPAAVVVPDAFTASVTVDEAPLPDDLPAPETTTELLPVRDMDAEPGAARLGPTMTVAGAVPGLFGGTRDERSCDPDQLVTFLAAEPEKGEAWAEVHDLDADHIGDFVAGLTPMVLTRDTHVTNHGFRDGDAYRIQSVLEAGTAVLVDDRGLPAVKCGCGNPLLPAATIDPDVELAITGTPWRGWHPDRVVVIGVDTRVETFVCIDLAGGEPFLRQVGPSVRDRALPAAELCQLIPNAPSCEPEPEPEPSEPVPDVTATRDAGWRDTAAHYRGLGIVVAYTCPAGGEAHTVWGTDLYTDDSSVCTAAVHAGVLDLERGGTVTIWILPGADSYVGSQRNGITTRDYGRWGGTFEVLGGTPGEVVEEVVEFELRSCPDYAFTDGSGDGMFMIETYGIACDEFTRYVDRMVDGDYSDGFDCGSTSQTGHAGRCDHADGRWFTWIDGN